MEFVWRMYIKVASANQENSNAARKLEYWNIGKLEGGIEDQI